MATVINNPSTDTAGTGGWATAIIVLAIIVLGALAFFVFGVGNSSSGGAGTQVTVPVNLGSDGAAGDGTPAP